MAQAYEFALDKMGMDFSSYSLWNEHILFINNVEAQDSYAQNQKISAIRKIYHRGIIIPMLNVENLWYEADFILIKLRRSVFTLFGSLSLNVHWTLHRIRTHVSSARTFVSLFQA